MMMTMMMAFGDYVHSAIVQLYQDTQENGLDMQSAVNNITSCRVVFIFMSK